MSRRSTTSTRTPGRRVAVAIIVALALASTAAVSVASARPPRYRPGAVLVGFRPGVPVARQRAIETAIGAVRPHRLGPLPRTSRRHRRARSLAVLSLRLRRRSVMAAVRALRRNRAVSYVEPDYLMHVAGTPNDPSFGLQWGSQNLGQTVNGVTGTAGADDHATTAWGVATGSRSIVIGETDTGVDYRHPDLAANIWTNPGGIGGCATGTRGYNVLTSSCDPMDDETYYGGHGTHVAGILGAVGNNGIGVAGMNWATTILPVKWLDSNGNGYTSDLITALNWVLQAKQAGVNVRVVNDSATFVGTAYSQALSDEIDTLGANGILFVTAAGNTGDDNDVLSTRRYPCGYDRPTEICVTASNQTDHLPSWANYGQATVDLAAPGDNVLSTLRNGTYGYVSGGSMASPQVAGTAALVLSKQDMSPTALKADILDHVDPIPALSGLVRTGGRLDVCAALPGCSQAPPPPPASTFGKVSVGGSSDSFAANRKRVNRYTLSTAGAVSKLSIYLTPTGTSGQQVLRGVVYADASGAPGALLATTSELTFHSTQSAGWYDLTLAQPVDLAAGSYWIGVVTGGTSHVAGFRWDSVNGSRAVNVNTYSAGPSNPFGSPSRDAEQTSLYATYTPDPAPSTAPTNTVAPAISGSASTGQTLSASPGSWSPAATTYAYSWQRCNSSGGACASIAGATGQSYTAGTADVGATLRVAVTASNSAGSSAPSTSAPTGVVAASSATFGKVSVGGSSDSFAANRKRVNRYTLSTAGAVSKLSIYLTPTGTSGQQVLRGVVYADAGGAPGALLATTNELTFHSTQSAGWYDLTLPQSLHLGAGSYWIGVVTGGTSYVAGFRWDSVNGSRAFNVNTYSAGPSNPFGSPSWDAEQTSLYATYTPG